jgi:hypothetical protein
MTNRTRTILILLILLLFIVALGLELARAYSESAVYMPLIFKGGVYYDTPTPTVTLTPTPTRTPRPPTPTPTATPPYIRAEGGNTCVVALGSRYSEIGDGIKFSGQVPGLCSKLEVQREEYIGSYRLLVIKAYRIKTDTYGCRQSDFKEGIPWPPVEDSCPPVLPLYDEIGRPLWGAYESFETEKSAKVACGYDDTNPPTYTFNCVNTVK